MQIIIRLIAKVYGHDENDGYVLQFVWYCFAIFNSITSNSWHNLILISDKETVVFNAVVTKHGHFERNTPVHIIYDQVLYDTHNAYSNQTGAFTAPIDGLYVFTWTTLVEAKKIMNTELLVNRIRTGLGSCDNEGNNGYENCSNTIPVLLKAGDEVSIRSTTGNYIYGSTWSSFKGWRT